MYTTDFNSRVNVSYCAFALNFMDVRVHQPVNAMRQSGVNIALNERSLRFIENVPENEPKILVLQRAFLTKESWPKALAMCIKLGWLMVVEYDDYPENPFNAAKRAASLDWERFRACHAVQVSTPLLAKAFKPYNSEIGLFENQLYQVPAPVARKPNETRLFFGALNRKSAWAPLIDRYNKVLTANPKLQAVVLHDKEFFEALKTDNKLFHPAADYSSYLKILHSCDISLQPLDDNKFNRHKSDIKFVEAASGGLAVLASPTVYENTIEHEHTGLIAHTPKDWEHYLEKLVTDKAFRTNIGTNAQSYVRCNRLLSQHIYKRIDWYRHLWANRQALNDRLLKLYPELLD